MDYLIIFFVFIIFLVLIIFGLPKSQLSFNDQVRQLESTNVRENFANSSQSDVKQGASTFYDWMGIANKNPSAPSGKLIKNSNEEECLIPPHVKPKCTGGNCLDDPNTYVKNEFNVYPVTRTDNVINQQNDCSKCDAMKCNNIDRYVLKTSVPPCPDMSQYALKSMIPPTPDLKDYIKKTEIPPCPSIPDMNEYIRKSEIPSCPQCPDMKDYVRKSEIPACPPKVECPTCPKCPKCPEFPQKCPKCPEAECPECPKCPSFPSCPPEKNCPPEKKCPPEKNCPPEKKCPENKCPKCPDIPRMEPVKCPKPKDNSGEMKKMQEELNKYKSELDKTKKELENAKKNKDNSKSNDNQSKNKIEAKKLNNKKILEEEYHPKQDKIASFFTKLGKSRYVSKPAPIREETYEIDKEPPKKEQPKIRVREEEMPKHVSTLDKIANFFKGVGTGKRKYISKPAPIKQEEQQKNINQKKFNQFEQELKNRKIVEEEALRKRMQINKRIDEEEMQRNRNRMNQEIEDDLLRRKNKLNQEVDDDLKRKRDEINRKIKEEEDMLYRIRNNTRSRIQEEDSYLNKMRDRIAEEEKQMKKVKFKIPEEEYKPKKFSMFSSDQDELNIVKKKYQTYQEEQNTIFKQKLFTPEKQIFKNIKTPIKVEDEYIPIAPKNIDIPEEEYISNSFSINRNFNMQEPVIKQEEYMQKQRINQDEYFPKQNLGKAKYLQKPTIRQEEYIPKPIRQEEYIPKPTIRQEEYIPLPVRQQQYMPKQKIYQEESNSLFFPMKKNEITFSKPSFNNYIFDTPTNGDLFKKDLPNKMEDNYQKVIPKLNKKESVAIIASEDFDDMPEKCKEGETLDAEFTSSYYKN